MCHFAPQRTSDPSQILHALNRSINSSPTCENCLQTIYLVGEGNLEPFRMTISTITNNKHYLEKISNFKPKFSNRICLLLRLGGQSA